MPSLALGHTTGHEKSEGGCHHPPSLYCLGWLPLHPSQPLRSHRGMRGTHHSLMSKPLLDRPSVSVKRSIAFATQMV